MGCLVFLLIYNVYKHRFNFCSLFSENNFSKHICFKGVPLNKFHTCFTTASEKMPFSFFFLFKTKKKWKTDSLKQVFDKYATVAWHIGIPTTSLHDKWVCQHAGRGTQQGSWREKNTSTRRRRSKKLVLINGLKVKGWHHRAIYKYRSHPDFQLLGAKRGCQSSHGWFTIT